jgi:hypothetical protein
MFRSILSVVVGYLVMAVCVMIAFSLALVAPEFAFQKDTCTVAPAFIVYGLVMGALGALAGGYVAAALAGQGARLAVKVLAGFVLALGLVLAVAGLFREERQAPAEEVARMSPMERASHGVQPVWYTFLIPFLGSGSVLAGGALRNRHR